MMTLMARIFLKGRTGDALRKGYGVLCGAVGVVLNLLLFLGKLLFSGGSIAMVADAVNNLSDAGSSFVALTGFLLAGQKPDPHHPFGHGRAEYLAGLGVSVLILLMGLELAKTSLERIFLPGAAGVQEAWGASAAVLAASIGVKLYMAFYNRRLGRRLNSAVLLAASSDSLGDCAATAVVLAAGAAGRYTSLPLDGWGGLLVAALILWSGVQAARSTIDPLLGTPPSPEFVEQIRSLTLGHPAIRGIHDLIVHDYGPGRRMISLHAEVPADQDVMTLHDAVDHVERELRERLGCEVVIHMDPLASDSLTEDLRQRVEALAGCIDSAITLHDFRVVAGQDVIKLIFDAAVPFRFRLSDREVEEKLQAAVRAMDSRCQAAVSVERSYT